MLLRRLALCASTIALSHLVAPAPAAAQPLGAFRWQMQPYCNVISVTVVQQGSQYQLDGTDDQCGAAQQASVTGLAFLNPNGSIGFGLNIVTAPGGQPVHVAATIALANLSGTWTDSAGTSGSFVFTPGAGTGGSPRPAAGIGGASIDPTQIQTRVSGTCPAGQLMTGVNQNGTVQCQSVTAAGGGDITGVSAGSGLTGGGLSGDVSLSVNFGGPGAATTVARSDHNHSAAGINNTRIGLNALPANTTGSNNTAIGMQAQSGNTTGSFNTSVGVNALLTNTTGGANTAMGFAALQAGTASANTAVGSFAMGSGVVAGDNNTAVGQIALQSLTTGYDNVGVGQRAMNGLTTGYRNVAVGKDAMALNTTGFVNTAVGAYSLSSNTTGAGNTASGAYALGANTTGSSVTAFGYVALGANTTGNDNTASGAGALQSNTTGNGNTANGTTALRDNTIGGANTAAGFRALRANTTGTDNTALGIDALLENTTGGLNTALGGGALRSNLSGSANVAVGSGALLSTTASGNVAMGYLAALNTVSGVNTAIGTQALYSNVSGQANVAIGFNSLGSALGSGNIAIGSGFSLVNGDNNIYLGADGGLATESNATYIRGISDATSASGVGVFVNAAGKLGTLTSSIRFKEDVQPITDVAAQIQALRPVTFYYKPEFDDGSHVQQYGLIAEEVAEAMPGLVARDTDGAIQTVRYQFLTPLLLAEVQRLERERAELTKQVADQATAIAELRTLLEDLRARMR